MYDFVGATTDPLSTLTGYSAAIIGNWVGVSVDPERMAEGVNGPLNIAAELLGKKMGKYLEDVGENHVHVTHILTAKFGAIFNHKRQILLEICQRPEKQCAPRFWLNVYPLY